MTPCLKEASNSKNEAVKGWKRILKDHIKGEGPICVQDIKLIKKCIVITV